MFVTVEPPLRTVVPLSQPPALIARDMAGLYKERIETCFINKLGPVPGHAKQLRSQGFTLVVQYSDNTNLPAENDKIWHSAITLGGKEGPVISVVG